MSNAAPNEPLDFVIIGAGMSGLCMAIQLRRIGIESFVMLEKSDDVGGTWLENSYPNSGCDVPSFLYSFSFAQKMNWTQKYARQPEILKYFQDVADQFDIRKHVRFHHTVREARYDEQAMLWHVTTESGESLTTRFLVSAVGQLNRPLIPTIPGTETFQGTTWHSARWNREFDLSGKRVAIIGNGASTIQFIPEVAKKAAQLTLFQRTPSWIRPQHNYRYPAWATWCFQHLPLVARLHRLWIFLSHEIRFVAFQKESLVNRNYQSWLVRQMKSRLPQKLHETLIPTYPAGCNRILQSSDYLQTVQQPHVEVVSETVEQFDASGLKTATRHFPLDAVIYGTGFRATEFLQPMKIVGRAGETLAAAWQDHPRTLYGLMTPRFPNLFLLYGPNTNLGHNSIIYMVESQVRYLLKCLAAIRQAGHREVEVREAAVKKHDEELHRLLGNTVWAGDCSSWYKTAEGVIPNNWFGAALAYRRRLNRTDLASFAFR